MGRLLKRIFGRKAESEERELLLKSELEEIKNTLGELRADLKAVTERLREPLPEAQISPRQVLDEYLNGVGNE